jgi:hypothetical protein
MSFVEKRDIIDKGRRTPILDIVQQNKSKRRFFNMSMYKHPWLSGCSHLNRFFCWYCLLFATDNNGIWNKSGYNDLNNFHSAVKKHDQCLSHLQSSVLYHSFGSVRIETSLSEQLKEDMSRHNAKVEKNRNIFRRLIDVTMFLGKQELSFRGHDESSSSFNKGNFRELVNLWAEYDSLLDEHVSSSNDNLSNRIQNDLISSIANVMINCVKVEIKNSDFVSVIIDETPDVSGKEQLVLVFRYFSGARVYDRFIEFINVSADRRADALVAILRERIDIFQCRDKLVGQTYDGAAVLSSNKNGVQQKLKEFCPNALYVWCSAHVLNLVLSKSCSRITEFAHFFHTIKSLGNFFNHSTKRKNTYNLFCSVKMPKVAPTRWEYNSRSVYVIFKQRINLIEVFESMEENYIDWDTDTIDKVRNYLFVLKSFDFNLYLTIFHRIFEKTDVLYNVIQDSTVDIQTCLTYIQQFVSWLQIFRLEFNSLFDANVSAFSQPKRKRNIDDPKIYYKQLFFEIIDNISTEINDRYRDINALSFFKLLDPNSFAAYSSEFPTDKFSSLRCFYGVLSILIGFKTNYLFFIVHRI